MHLTPPFCGRVAHFGPVRQLTKSAERTPTPHAYRPEEAHPGDRHESHASGHGALPTEQSLADAIAHVDASTDGYPAYYMINCAHPDHFGGALSDAPWARRIRGVRANASRRSHAELDAAPELDAGNPQELASQYRELARRLPWMNVFGGCCGSDLRHVTEIARALARG